MSHSKALTALARFEIPGDSYRLEPLTQGLINASYRVWSGGQQAFVLQQLNSTVFKKPRLLMENICRTLPVLQGPNYAGLTLVKTKEGKFWLEDDELHTWRLFRFIPGSGTMTSTDDPGTAREAGRIVGCFHQLVSKAPISDLHTTLPGFHNLSLRTTQLEAAAGTGITERIDNARALLGVARKLIESCGQIPFTSLPLRICHNDTKLSNILFEETTGRGLCMIDLDTLMPGHLLYDFGDAARTLISPVAEAQSDPVEIRIESTMFKAFASGWKESGIKMEPIEADWLCHGVLLMPALHGIRALTDYMTGDRYYRTTYPEQNLQRAGNLLNFATLVLEKLPEMQGILRESLT
jgi:hypothetical protein